MKLSDIIQKIIPFGYTYLVVLGIMKESIYYYQVGINILKYSNIMDILISPIADLTSTPLLLIAVIILISLFLLIGLYISKNLHKDRIKAKVNSKKPLADITEEEVKTYYSKVFIGMIAVNLLCFFVGIGWGEGSKVAKKISNNELTYNYKMTFGDDQTKEIYLIGSNSSNYFYVEKGNKNITISPVGSIKSLEITKNKRLNK
ncbi:hypothetical protein [Flavobacterium sp.]|uniref:hypothetical protein n=1 Tax=Flavobacterium sp. TaxID=239 RepID=UPI0026212357|nr:hypothetical protein [Flavobacterium sp.]MDG2433745.1 hypothetical protein [Flavobacterium sp.]